MNEFSFAQQGWQCPICKRVYSPFTPSCFCCGNEKTITTTDVTITTPVNEGPWAMDVPPSGKDKSEDK